MAQQNAPYGLSRDQELDPQRTKRDVRTLMEMVGDALANYPAIPQILAGIQLPVAYVSPTVFVLFCVPLMLWLTAHPLNKSLTLPMVLPEEAKMADENDPKPGRFSDFKARGRIFLGNARFMRKPFELWLGFTHILQHVFLVGTTGAGKTETLVSMAANYVAAGSGFMYSDAKAGTKLGWQLFTLARFFGREDDFRALNYIKGNTSEKPDPASRQSHTVNLFAYGSANAITQIIVSIMPPGGNENKLFSERAIGLIYAVMPALVDLRDRVDLLITPAVIRKSLEMDEVENLKKHPDITKQSREAIRAYLASLPGYKEDPGIDPRSKQKKPQPEEVGKQFGFAQAYFTRALASLSDTYADIYMVGHGEISFLDMVLRRRIGAVMIPAIENAPDEQKNLAKIVLAAQKNAVSTGIPPQIEGRREDILESLPTSAPTPYGIINDEFAFMMTEGYGTLLAQSRSLYVSFIIAGQDYAGMKRENEDEAEQIAENTKLKIVMASEGLGATAQLVKEIAGEGLAATAQSYTRESGSVTGTYNDGQSATFEKQARVDTMDTRGQIEGEGIAFWRDKIIPFNSFFHGLDDKHIIKEFRITRMPDVQRPTRGHAYERTRNESPEYRAIQQVVQYGTEFDASQLGVDDDLGYLHRALNRRRQELESGKDIRIADGTLYGTLANALDQYLVDGHSEPVGELAQTLQDSVGQSQQPDVIEQADPPEQVSSPEKEVSPAPSEEIPKPGPQEPEWDDMEDELPGAPVPEQAAPEASEDEDSSSATGNSGVAPVLEESGAHRVLSSAPWLLDPSLIDEVAERDINESERELIRDAADSVTRIETAAGTSEDQAQAIGVTTADAVARNIRYPSSARARMPEPASEEERKQVVERNRGIFMDWLNAADETEPEPDSEGWQHP